MPRDFALLLLALFFFPATVGAQYAGVLVPDPATLGPSLFSANSDTLLSPVPLNRRWSWSYNGPPYFLPEDSRNAFFPRLWRDISVQALAPFRYAGEHPFRFAGGVVLLGGLVYSDRFTYHNLQLGQENWGGDEMNRLSRDLSHYGQFYYLVPIYAGLGLHAWLGDSEKSLETIRLLTEAFLTTGLWTSLAKSVIGRERPREVDDDTWDFDPMEAFLRREKAEAWKTFASLPSGHASAVFTTAAILSYQYPKYGIVPALSYSVATLVGLSRVTEKAHWPSDIIIGGLLGWWCARQVVRDNPSEYSRKIFHITGLILNVDRNSFQTGVSFWVGK